MELALNYCYNSIYGHLCGLTDFDFLDRLLLTKPNSEYRNQMNKSFTLMCVSSYCIAY